MIPDDVPSSALTYRLLGSFSALVNNEPVVCGGVKQRSVLAMLLLEPNRPITTGRLTEGLWGDHPPDRALATIQVYVSGLRRALPTVDGVSPIETRPNGYTIKTDPESVDIDRFKASLAAADEADRFRDHRLTLRHLGAALDEWRGPPLADFEAIPFATGPVISLNQQRENARERQLETRMQLGDHRAVLPELEAAVVELPLRESLWRLLMLALYRSGRQADALAAFQRCRDMLLAELGLDPASETQALELAILRQDETLQASASNERPQRGALTVPAQPVQKFTLSINSGDRRPLESDILIGRSDDCDIVVDEPQVSRRHAEIRRGPTGWILSDLSMNGTMVNGHLCTRHTIAAGDVIVVGNQPMTIEAAQ